MSHPAPTPRTGQLPCMDGCVCSVRAIIAAANDAPEREPAQLDNAEVRALLAAVESGYARVCKDPRLAPRRHAALKRYGAADRAVNALEGLVKSGSLGRRAEAVRLSRKEAAAAAARPPLWLRLVRWPVVIAVGVFDTWYFMQVFQYLTSSVGTKLSTIENVVSAVPGIVLALGIALCGTILAVPFGAWRDAASACAVPAASASGDAGSRAARLGRFLIRFSWRLLPVAFAFIMLSVIMLWAYLRARGPAALSTVSISSPYPLLAVAVLIAMLTVIAIFVKMAAHAPECERASRQAAQLWAVRQWHRFRAWQCDRRIDTCAAAWSDMRTLRDELLGALRLTDIAAWEGFILRTRALHGKAGHLPPPFTSPDTNSAQGTNTGDGGNGASGANGHKPTQPLPEFEDIRQPRPELGPLREICLLLNEVHPESLRRRKTEIDACAIGQLVPMSQPEQNGAAIPAAPPQS